MRYRLPLAIIWAIIWAIGACLNASPADNAAGWGSVQYLVGDWTGEGGGGPGQGAGSFSFKPDLQGKILVRKNRAEYPAAKERAASVHDDLMVIYRDTPEAALRAIYFDSEGHTIRYEVQAPPGKPEQFATYIEAGARRSAK